MSVKITFALPGINGLSGGLRVVAQYSQHLLEHGHEVTLAVRRPSHEPGRRQRFMARLGFGRPTSSLPEDQGHFKGLDIPVVHLDEARLVQPSDLPDADLIVSTWWSTAEWADRLPCNKGRHVHFIQGYEFFSEFYKKRVALVYAQKNAKIVVSGWLKNKLLEDFDQESRIVLNGVDTALFQTPERARLHPRRIGFLYSSHPVKNSFLAVEALSIVANKRTDLEFVSFGSEPRPDGFPSWISYEHRPNQSCIAEIYASCDLWLFVSTEEGFGLPILEAMASRTPVLATPAGAAPDLVDGTNGRLAPFDVDGFAQAILDFLNQSDAAWKTCSDAAWQTAQRHDLRLSAQAFEDALVRIHEGNG